MEPIVLAFVLGATLMAGAMYPQLGSAAGPVPAASAEGRAAGQERERKRKQMEREANKPQSSLLAFFRRSTAYQPDTQVRGPPPDEEEEEARRKALAQGRWGCFVRDLFAKLKRAGGRPPNPRQLQKEPRKWFPGIVRKPNSENKCTKITEDDLKLCPNPNYVLHFRAREIPDFAKGYVAVELTRDNFGSGKDHKWLATKRSKPPSP